MESLFGLHGSFLAHPGRGDELAAILVEAADAARSDHSCRLYVVHRSVDDPDRVWVTEAWTDRAAHAAALEDPDTRAMIARAMPLIAGMGDSVELRTVGGKGV